MNRSANIQGQAARRASARRSSAARRGFTLIEILVGLGILVLILSILLFSLNHARKLARSGAQGQSVAALKVAAQTFIQDFNFPPPIVKDMRNYPKPAKLVDVYETANGEAKLAVYDISKPADLDSMRRKVPVPPPSGWGTDKKAEDYYDVRFSTASLAYYLVGVADRPVSAATKLPVDGVSGPGFLRPRVDGTFEIPESLKAKPLNGPGGNNQAGRLGETFGPFIDATKGQMKVVRNGEKSELVDDKGIAYRLYRWEKGNPTTGTVTKASEQNIPWILVQTFTPEGYRNFPVDDPKRKEPECSSRMVGLNSATYAIVAAGPNGVFGDEPIDELRSKLTGGNALTDEAARRRALEDNIVEVGQ